MVVDVKGILPSLFLRKLHLYLVQDSPLATYIRPTVSVCCTSARPRNSALGSHESIPESIRKPPPSRIRIHCHHAPLLLITSCHVAQYAQNPLQAGIAQIVRAIRYWNSSDVDFFVEDLHMNVLRTKPTPCKTLRNAHLTSLQGYTKMA